MLFWPHPEGSLTNLPKVFLRITGRKFNSFHENIIYRKIPLSSFKVAVTKLSKNICQRSKDFYWTTGDTYDTMMSFRRKTSSRFYCGQAECSFDKLTKRVSLESKFCSLPIRIYSETVISNRTKKIPKEKPQDTLNAVLTNVPKTFTMRSGKIFPQNSKKSGIQQYFSKKNCFLWHKPLKTLNIVVTTLLKKACRTSEKKIRSKIVKILVIILLSQTIFFPKMILWIQKTQFWQGGWTSFAIIKKFLLLKRKRNFNFLIQIFFPQNVPLWR